MSSEKATNNDELFKDLNNDPDEWFNNIKNDLEKKTKSAKDYVKDAATSSNEIEKKINKDRAFYTLKHRNQIIDILKSHYKIFAHSKALRTCNCYKEGYDELMKYIKKSEELIKTYTPREKEDIQNKQGGKGKSKKKTRRNKRITKNKK